MDEVIVLHLIKKYIKKTNKYHSVLIKNLLVKEDRCQDNE